LAVWQLGRPRTKARAKGTKKKPAFGGLLGRPGMLPEGCLVARVTT
jgi:hypothetical protein